MAAAFDLVQERVEGMPPEASGLVETFVSDLHAAVVKLEAEYAAAQAMHDHFQVRVARNSLVRMVGARCAQGRCALCAWSVRVGMLHIACRRVACMFRKLGACCAYARCVHCAHVRCALRMLRARCAHGWRLARLRVCGTRVDKWYLRSHVQGLPEKVSQLTSRAKRNNVDQVRARCAHSPSHSCRLAHECGFCAAGQDR